MRQKIEEVKARTVRLRVLSQFEEETGRNVVDAAFRVHKELGPGLLERIGAVLVVVAMLGCEPQKQPDLSTPEATISTYYEGYITGKKELTEKASGGPFTSHAGFDSVLVEAYRIVSNEPLLNDSIRSTRENRLIAVQITFVDPEQPPLVVKHVLQKHDELWVSVRHWYVADDNYPSDDPPEFYEN